MGSHKEFRKIGFKVSLFWLGLEINLAHGFDGPFFREFHRKYSNNSISLYTYLVSYKKPMLSRRRGLPEMGPFGIGTLQQIIPKSLSN